ncbi:MAG TPA: LPS export ABC transporter permease LptG, partial [Geobacteraceae bacterium]|nr:LPS export ABC transporter permease LptG [Geobacteraceae bacterium]
MTIISRFLVKTYLGMIGTCMSAFVAIYLVVDFLDRFGRFSRAGVPMKSTLYYFLCKIPEIINQTTPMAVLMGTILAIGALARNSEITAMRSSGISLVQIGRPLVATAALISTALLLMQEFVVPRANEKVLYIDHVLVQKKGTETFFRRNNIWHRSGNLIMQAKLFEPGTQTLRGITIWELAKGLTPLVRIDAPSATPVGGDWNLVDVTKRDLRQTGTSPQEKLAGLKINLDLQLADLKVVAKSADDMGFIDLWQYCESLSDGGYDTTRYRTLLHAKLSLPFAALVMAFLGIPFSLRDGRSSGMGIGIGISIII